MNSSLANTRSRTVLVTGGSGYLGSWAIVGLLKQGWRVRATLRSLAREEEVRAMVAQEVEAGDRLSFVQANLLHDAGWDAATRDVDSVLHVASPMPVGEYRRHDLMTPARDGTRRVLAAALRHGVRRVVFTSSTTAAVPRSPSLVADESVWAEYPDNPAYQYPRSKTLAEQDAWAFIRDSGGRMELVTVLPSQIQGPVLGSDFSASVGIVQMMLGGKMPALPRVGFGIVDVRDLVDLHLLALDAPQAAGQRFIASGEFLWFRDIARILKEHLGPAAQRVSTRPLPDVIVRLGGLFNRELRQLSPSLGVRHRLDAGKAKRLLGWETRPAAESIIDAARSLIERRLVQATGS